MLLSVMENAGHREAIRQIEGRIQTIKSIMYTASQADDERFNNMNSVLQDQITQIASEAEKGKCRCGATCSGPMARGAGSPPLGGSVHADLSGGGADASQDPGNRVFGEQPRPTYEHQGGGRQGPGGSSAKPSGGQDLTRYSTIFMSKFKDDVLRYDGRKDGEGWRPRVLNHLIARCPDIKEAMDLGGGAWA